MLGFVISIILIIVTIILIIANVRIVPQTNAYVIERLGGYLTTWDVGLKFKIPLIDRIASKVSLKEKVVDFPPQPVITKDNVTMSIDTVVYYQITDPKLFAYGVSNPIIAIENLTATTLRNIIGQLELDESLSSRDLINTQMRSILDEATDPWGIRVNRVEVKNIEPPADIQEAMEKQMRAERERRESILRAEGKKRAAILVAEGEKESAIRKAEGQAEAIIKVKKATAEGIEMIKNAKADETVIALRSLETLAKVADGRATKLIIPSDIQNISGLVSSLTAVNDFTKKDDVLKDSEVLEKEDVLED
ncbi:MAG TPA: SPFH domain-containing protein [Clostridia bacterium]|nr:SPFH domain-containing protein [Clostridia bacterium]